MTDFELEIADLAAEFDTYRVGGSKKIVLPDEVKSKASALYHRKGKMTLLDLSKGLRVSPGAVRHWSISFKPERRPSSKMIPLRVVGRAAGVAGIAPQSSSAITVSFHDLIITIPATMDSGFVVSLIDTLLERAAC
jgi:hypothetical protein